MKLEKFIYQIRNWKAHWRAFWMGAYILCEGPVARLFGFDRVIFEGAVNVTVKRKDGSELDLGCVGRRVVTTAGVNYLRDDFNAAAGGADITNFKYHGCGTGAVAEAIGDTALGAECTTVLYPDSTRAVGSQSGATSKTYITIGTLTFDGTPTVTEHGIFSAAAAGTLWDRTVFAGIPMAVGDSIQFTYTLTISDGG